jgi:O-antigen biosynthesis protein
MTSWFEPDGTRPGPIFIFGVGGSGTRALAGILRELGIRIGSPLNTELDALAFDAVCERYVTPVLEQAGSANHGIHQVDVALRAQILRALELAAMVHLNEERSPMVWAAKSPRLIYLLPFLSVAFPGARFVHVVRDGRDMALSSNQNQVRKHFSAMFGGPVPRDSEQAAMRLWSTVNVDASAHGRLAIGSSYQIVRYEDLCREPAETVVTFMAGLGLSVDQDARKRAAGQVRPSASLGRGLKIAGGKRSELEAIGERGLRLFGYLPRRQPGGEESVAKKIVVFVTGSHRGGTSVAAGIVQSLGFDVGQSEMPPHRDNPAGYWENSALVVLNDQLMRAFGREWWSLDPFPADWLKGGLAIEGFREKLRDTLDREMEPSLGWCIKDPRLCHTLPVWLEEARQLGRESKVVLVIRDPREVAASLKKRDRFSLKRALRLWAIGLEESERGSRTVPRIFLRYDEIIADPNGTRAGIAGFLEAGEIDRVAGASESIVDPKLRNHVADDMPSDLAGPLEAKVLHAWRAATGLAADDTPETREALRRALKDLCAVTVDAYVEQAIDHKAERNAMTFAGRMRAERDPGAVREILEAGNPAAALEVHLVRPSPPLGVIDAYQRWIDTYEPTLILPRAEVAPAFPRSTIVVLPPGAARVMDQALSERIQSLRAAGATVVSTSEDMRDHHRLAEMCQPCPALDEIPGAGWLPRLARETPAAWFIFIETGPRLVADFTEQVVAAMRDHPDAKILHGDHDHLDSEGGRTDPVFKPTHWDHDLHLQANIVRGWIAVDVDTLADRASPAGSSPWELFYDLSMRVTERTPDRMILHIPRILAHVPADGPLMAARLEAGAERVRRDALTRAGHRAVLMKGVWPFTNHVRWTPPTPNPLVSVIILTRDGGAHLQTCLLGLLRETRYERIEVIVIDNGSQDADTLKLLGVVERDQRCRVIRHDIPFNFAKLVNLAVGQAKGELLCLLNDDIRVLHAGWLEEMVGLAARLDVGMVGAHMLFDDGSVQHAGVTLGLEGHVAGHLYHYASEAEMRRRPLHNLARQMSAVTAACCVMRREVFEAVGGMDAENFAVNYNDVDLCLRMRERGWKILWTPYARLVHAESLSRGKAAKADRIALSTAEGGAISARWAREIKADPFWNPNLSLENVIPKLSFLPRANAPVATGIDWTRARLLEASWDVARTARILPELAVFHAAKLATHLGLSDRAATFAIEAVVFEPANYTANLAAGTCLARVNDLARSADLYRNANLISPSALRPWLYLGQIAARRGRNQQAMAYLDEVLRRDPANELAKSMRERLGDAE